MIILIIVWISILRSFTNILYRECNKLLSLISNRSLNHMQEIPLIKILSNILLIVTPVNSICKRNRVCKSLTKPSFIYQGISRIYSKLSNNIFSIFNIKLFSRMFRAIHHIERIKNEN